MEKERAMDGSSAIATALLRAFAQQELGHCLLFVGGERQHRADMTASLARVLLCSDPEEARPCARCKACACALLLHPDYLAVTVPDEGRSIGVEEVARLTHFAALSSTAGGYRVAVIAESHMLTTPAANALLKVLEEPPDRFICILSAHASSRVLPTIRSRAQCFRLTQSRPTPGSAHVVSEAISELASASAGMEFTGALDDMERAAHAALITDFAKEPATGSGVRGTLALLRRIARSRQFAHASVNPRTILEWLRLENTV